MSQGRNGVNIEHDTNTYCIPFISYIYNIFECANICWMSLMYLWAVHVHWVVWEDMQVCFPFGCYRSHRCFFAPLKHLQSTCLGLNVPRFMVGGGVQLFRVFTVSGAPSWHAEISRILTWHGLPFVALRLVVESFYPQRFRRYWQQKVTRDNRLIGRQGTRHKAETAWALNMFEFETHYWLYSF